MQQHKSPFRQSWDRLKQKKRVIAATSWLLLMLPVALFAPFLASDKPFYFEWKGNHFFPSLSGDERVLIKDASGIQQEIDFINPSPEILTESKIIKSPIPFAPDKSDMQNADYIGPADKQYDSNGKILTGFSKHLLGTGKRGEDILAGLIHGTKVSMSVGIFSMALAGLIGLVLGAISGFFGDEQLKMSRGKMILTIAGLFPAWFYAFQVRMFDLQDAMLSTSSYLIIQVLISSLIFIGILFLFNQSGKLLHSLSWFNKLLFIRADTIISRIIEVLISLPRLILIITMAAIAKPSLTNLILIIGFTSWTEIARFTRAEMLRIRNLDYIQSARSLGFSELRILFRHALPNAMAPALITISFGVAGAILMESALSFLGIGVPPQIATWGSLLSSGKENFSAWWLVVFPGLAIFLTVTSFNLLGEGLRDAFDPKLKK